MTTTADIGQRLKAGTIGVEDAVCELIGALAARAPCPASERAALVELLSCAVADNPELRALTAALHAATVAPHG